MFLFRICRRALGMLAGGLSNPPDRKAVAEISDFRSSEAEKLAEDMRRIGAWMAGNAPSHFSPIYCAPVSGEELTRAEEQVGAPFHPQLRALLDFTNGATGNAPALVNAFSLMAVDEIVSAYKFLLEEFPAFAPLLVGMADHAIGDGEFLAVGSFSLPHYFLRKYLNRWLTIPLQQGRLS